MQVKRNIVEIVQAMEKSVSWRSPGCVFRGEPACFEKVSSGLFRTYGLEKGEGDFSIETVEREMVEKARSFTDRKDSLDILCEIQHRGGSTNQIDFTRISRLVRQICSGAARRHRSCRARDLFHGKH